MTVFSPKGIYILIAITMLVIAGLAWQIFADDDKNESGQKIKVSHQTENIFAISPEEEMMEKETTNTKISSMQNSEQGSNPSAENSDLEIFPVYLVGAVNVPGIYEIKPGTYLYQLVEMAGGMSAEAAADQINLAARIYQNQLIRIPTETEMKNNPDMRYLTEEKPEALDQEREYNQADELSELININRADSKRLEELPGIGSATAQAIISYRQNSGKFNKIEDIMKVSGIKESRFEQIRELITVE